MCKSVCCFLGYTLNFQWRVYTILDDHLINNIMIPLSFPIFYRSDQILIQALGYQDQEINLNGIAPICPSPDPSVNTIFQRASIASDLD